MITIAYTIIGLAYFVMIFVIGAFTDELRSSFLILSGIISLLLFFPVSILTLYRQKIGLITGLIFLLFLFPWNLTAINEFLEFKNQKNYWTVLQIGMDSVLIIGYYFTIVLSIITLIKKWKTSWTEKNLDINEQTRKALTFLPLVVILIVIIAKII